ncbi:MAG: NADP-dependent phosphogluconate dehydrogenase [Peptostreptococcus sp.]|uniref:NADP-dependent phosphogluconate dehydrogenase n=1 Tax=Peptostreptococcus sp. TaxID=1262 RepID=UPI002FC973DF
MKSNIGVIGLSVMGMNLALNMADNGYKVSIFNRTTSVVDKVMKEHGHQNFSAFYNLEDFIKSLEKPRKIFMMVKSGEPVDMLIEQLINLVDEEDIIIDGGNSYFKDTIRRERYLKEKNIYFLGVGISGGEEGARFGPAIMPGGDEKAYSFVSEIFEKISAKAYGEPCCRYISRDGSGHYVKMVHNGIEYADMQLISEAYTILKKIGRFSNKELEEIFDSWNKSELESYLIEITANIFKVKEGRNYLLDVILDKASQKGTGKWTNFEAIDLGVDISVITAALNARFMSNLKDERMKAEKIIIDSSIEESLKNIDIDRKELIEIVKNSLYISKIISYAQGFKLLSVAESEYNWNFDFAEITKIFRGGCIIRAKFLNDISDAFKSSSEIDNLIFTDFFSREINSRLKDLRTLIGLAVKSGVSVNAMTSALGYIDTYKTSRSGANLIQAQRDYFGAHTFERLDKEGNFHYDWIDKNDK